MPVGMVTAHSLCYAGLWWTAQGRAFFRTRRDRPLRAGGVGYAGFALKFNCVKQYLL